jgi:NAD-dependent DNA ligase
MTTPPYNALFASLLSKLSTAMSTVGEQMRSRAYKRAEETILSTTEDINSVKDLENKPGIGQTTLNKLQEYLDTGKIKVLEEYENQPETLLSEVYGIGPKKAKDLVEHGITTIKQLREQQNKVLNDVQKKGLKYHADILKRIPRSEITLYDKEFKYFFSKEQDPEAKYEIVGSYRRGLETSGDIDVIITSSTRTTYDNFLDVLIKKGIITEILSRGKQKCLVVAKITDTHRRVDFLYATPEEYPFSVLYFTGSKGFNVVMRGHALKMGYSMNEHGFTGPSITQKIEAEEDIFKFLQLEYKMPKERLDGRAVIPLMTEESNKEIPVVEPILPPKITEKKETKKRKSKSPKQSKKKSPKDVPKDIPKEVIKALDEIVAEFKERGQPVLETLSESQLNVIMKKANDAYYNEEPILTDSEFDVIKEYVEMKYPKAEALTQIGAPIQGKNKVKLPFEMASMDKIKPDSGALESWSAKYKGPYVLSCKLDGVSGLYVSDDKGKYKLYTRGNGNIGQDVSHLIDVLDLPKMAKGMAVRGEFIISKKIFAEKYAAEFANARNMVSGIINRKSADEKACDLDFVVYEVVAPEMPPSKQMTTLAQTGFNVVQNKLEKKLTNTALSDILVDWRKSYDYEIDGVIVTNDAIYPRTSGNPAHAFAFKMVLSDQVAEARVVDVLWEASKNGYLKPRVRIVPIQLGGVTIEYATGFNGKFIEDNKIGVGAIIMMVRSGDVIPYIKSVTTPAEKAKMPLVPFVWNKTLVDVLLENPHEDEGVQEKNITMFFTSLEVDGLAKGNVHKLYQAGKTTVPQILRMTAADFQTVEGFQKKTAEKLADGIKTKVEAASLLDIMVASGKLGRGLGTRKMSPIMEAFPDILTSAGSSQDKEAALLCIEGIGKENAREFVKNIPAFLEFLRECGLENKLAESVTKGKSASAAAAAAAAAEVIQGPLTGKKIVMTKVRDQAIISFMTKQGATLEDSMKKDVFVLIVKSREDTSNKTEYAVKNGITIMTPEEFKSKYM